MECTCTEKDAEQAIPLKRCSFANPMIVTRPRLKCLFVLNRHNAMDDDDDYLLRDVADASLRDDDDEGEGEAKDTGLIKSTRVYQSYPPSKSRAPYGNHESIDWLYERDKERARLASLQNIRGLRGALALTVNRVTQWTIIFATGICVGFLAAYLDILTTWLGDFKEGICSDDAFLNRAECCMGLEPGEQCFSWRSWSNVFSFKSVAASSIAQYAVFILLSTLFASAASFLVGTYAPFAYHSGIPEIKAILGGYLIKGYLSPLVLLIKALSLTLAVASSLSLGKEGPLVHVACCVGSFFANRFPTYKGNEALQREILSASAAAGLSTAFGAPLGGVLFSLEEASSFFPMSVLWSAFICAVTAAICLQYQDVFGTGKLVLFQVMTNQVFRGFEIFPFLFIG